MRANCSRKGLLLFIGIVIGLVLPIVVLVSMYEERVLFRFDVMTKQPHEPRTKRSTTTDTTSSIMEITSSQEESLAPKLAPVVNSDSGDIENSHTVVTTTNPPSIVVPLVNNSDERSKSESISELVQSVAMVTTETKLNASAADNADSTNILIENESLFPSHIPSRRPIAFIEPPVIVQPPPPPPPLQRVHRNITLIVQLRGELGNQLSVLANARITQLLAQSKYPHIRIQIIGQHQYSDKWTRGRDDLVKCFSHAFHDFDFEGGSHDKSGEFMAVKQLQDAWLNAEQLKKLNNVRSLDFLNSLLLQQEQNASGVPILPASLSVSKYSLPYLTAIYFSWSDIIQSRHYYDDIRQWLTFNMKACCNPDIVRGDNDIVFHYRNFEYELRHKKNDLTSHFVEVSPYIIANVAYQNYTRRDHHRVAISSRYEAGTERYIQAFHKRGISSYYVTGQRSGNEGFCFLLQTQKETFGSYYSTYYRWAALLGNATLNRFYIIDGSLVTQTAAAAAVNITGNNSVVNDTIHDLVDATPIRSINTFVTGNRTFSIEVYHQL